MALTPSPYVFTTANATHIPLIMQMAADTWPAAYDHILPEGQVQYMLNLMYNPAALTSQMEEGQVFILAYLHNKPVGFAAYGSYSPGVFKLHKLYVLPGTQGSGLGQQLLQFVINKVREQAGVELMLNVNRQNKARYFYEKQGFLITGSVDVAIGQGYFMRDYVMVLPIAPANS